MTLPEIKLPNIELPFDIPTLLHPAVVHFVIAIPVVIFLLELYNLFTKRRSIGAFSFVLLLVTIAMLSIAYLTGLTDGKEAYELLTTDGQAELKAHKLLGIYVIFVALAVLVFKLLAMTGKGFFRFIYFISLVGLIGITLNQGKEGGELVYEHGANVERVKTLDDELFDAKEELEEVQEAAAQVVKKATPTVENQASQEVKETVVEKVETVTAPREITVPAEPATPAEPTLHTPDAPSAEALQNAISEVN